MNNNIKYNFVGINQSLDTLVTNTFEALESLESSINSITIENEEIADLLESAKKSVRKNIKIIKDAFEQNKNNAKAVCNEYKSFETQAKEHAFFKNDLSVKIVGEATYTDVSETQSTTGDETWLKIPEKYTTVSDMPSSTEYTIQSGDTLIKIANRNNTTVDALMEANKDSIKDPNVILAGATIVIPGVAATTESSNKTTKKTVENKTEKTEQKEEATKQENINKDSVTIDTKTTNSSGEVLGNYRITSYHPGDAGGSGTVTGSGKSVNDFSTMEIDGKNVYTYDGKVVVAAATEELRKAWGRDIIEGKHYFKYGDELTLKINGNEYQAIVLDSCGSSMKAGNQIVDIYVPSSADIINKYDVEIII